MVTTYKKLMVLVFWLSGYAQVAVADELDVITLGTTTALTGPAKLLGKSMVRGMMTHLKTVNTAGGINGYRFELIALDDGYHRQSARMQMTRLIDDYNVLAVIGNVGTPTAQETVPLANENEVPLIGALTGASLLRKPVPDRFVINYRASYDEEMAMVIDALLDNGVSAERIAFFTQNDSYGEAGYVGAIMALKRHGVENTERLVRGYYETNTLHVKQALITIINARPPPKAVIMIGTYGPSAKFIRKAQKILSDTLFVNISFVGAHALARELKGCCDNVYVSQVVPPLDSDLPAVQEFRQSLAYFYPDEKIDYVSFEGFIVAKIITEAVKKMGQQIDRVSLVNTIESLVDLDVGIGKALRYGPQDHQGSHHVWLTRIEGDNAVAASLNELH